MTAKLAKNRPPAWQDQHAFTLLEVVLALLLISSVTIGIAALYQHSDQVAHGSHLHEEAENLARRIAGEIRQHGDVRGNYETRIGQTCKSSDKQAASVHRVACWQEEVAARLTNGSSHIMLDTHFDPATYVIEVSWSEPGTGTASYVLQVPLSAASSDPAENAKS